MFRTLVFFFLVFHHKCSSQDIQSQAKQLLTLLSPEPAKGEPWPSIPGPNKEDRVCIVGAGVSGIHMATRLKKLSYRKIVIFEKTGRVGGKCFDINYRGTPQAQGADFLEANYFNEDSFVPFLKEYGLDDLVPVSSTDVWATNSAQDPGSRMTRAQFNLYAASKLTNSTSPEVNIGFFLQTIIRYIKLHKELFGLYDGDLMRRPSKEVLFRIRGTIMDFLTREKLLGMLPIFQSTQTLAGYGHVDEISALYGLIWHNPRLILTLAMKALKMDKIPFSLLSLKKGYEFVLREIVDKENLDIVFETDILNIKRRGESVYLKTWQNFAPKTEVCNFLIWTPEASELIRVLDKPTKEESHLLGSLKPSVYYAHLIDVKGGIRHSPTTAFMANVLQKKEEYAVTWTCDTAGLLTDGITSPEGIAEYNNRTDQRTLYTLHAPAKKATSEAFLKEKVRRHLMDGFGVENVEFLNTVAWSYLPRWTPSEAAEGRHWDVFDMQGKNKIWYAGVSASYESVRSVVSYNNRLLKQFQRGKSTTVTKGKCHYSCTGGGGCQVRLTPSLYYHGSYKSVGVCWLRGVCVGTPRQCVDCNKVIQC